MPKPLQVDSWLTRHPDLFLWGCFVILNCLLFLPLYLLSSENTTFWPVSTLISNPAETIRQLVWWRNNPDIFRFNAEMVLLLALWVYVRPVRRRWFPWLFGIVYLVMLSYYVYESIMLSVYNVNPVFYSHYRLAIDGLAVLIHNLQVPLYFYPAMIIILVILGGFIGFIIRVLLDKTVVERLNRGSKMGLAVLALATLLALVILRGVSASPKMVVSSFAWKLQKNIADSILAYQSVQNFDKATVQKVYDYSDYTLLYKPNIYLIFVESYGSVLYKRDDYRQAYTALLTELQAQLQTNGWHSVSALSQAPTWGAGSWMSYTSTLFGLRIDTQPQYLSLLEKYQADRYPDLGHFFKMQGYEYIRLSSLSVELEQAETLEDKQFYGFDRWLHFGDLNYRGAQYGWGASTPDQYALNFAYDNALSQADKPFFFFFTTQNSHYPWAPLPALASDWRTLNEVTTVADTPSPELIPPSIRRQNYLNAIEYELRFLTDFVRQKGDDRAVFIFIGDHQPPRVSRPEDSFDTPVHIISRNAALVDAFLDYGFEKGLIVNNPTAVIRHEGLYSLLARVLLAQYGSSGKTLPPYLPDGIIFEDAVKGTGKN